MSASVAVIATGGYGAHSQAAPVRVVLVQTTTNLTPALSEAKNSLRTTAATAGLRWIDRDRPAPPDASASEGRRRAIDAYEGLRFDAALAELDRSIAELDRRGNIGLEPAELSDLFLYRALTRTQLGDTSAAWEDFVRTATIAPQRTLDPVRFPPRAVESFERARAAVAALVPTALTIDVPASCEVTIDGLVRRTANVTPGDHFVAVRCHGRLAFGGRVMTTAQPQVFAPPLANTDLLTDAQLLDTHPVWRNDDRVVAFFAVGDGNGVTVSLRRYEAVTDRALATATVTLTGPPAADKRSLETALQSTIADIVVPSPVVVAAPRRWYQRPWVWAVASAATTALVLTPFLLSDDTGTSSATIKPTGQLPW